VPGVLLLLPPALSATLKVLLPRNTSILIVCLAIFLGCLFGQPARAQMAIKLKPETVKEFDQYVKKAEAGLNERWSGKKDFFEIAGNEADRRKILAGEFIVRALNNGQPAEITEGLIHDWAGAIYIPHTTMQNVLSILQNFDQHKNIYPNVADSKTIRHSGNEVTGYWRLQQKGLVPVTLEVEQDAHYQQLAPDKWICRAYGTKITEINTGLFSRGSRYPLGEGHGYMWRLYAYWSLQEVNGGVLAECRTISLSRNIPEGLAWAVGPYVQKMPQDSLTSTLKETRKAASKAHS
jgi:hypothetical protein